MSGDGDGQGNGANEKFNAELDMLLRGELPMGHVFGLGFPGEILRKAGFPGDQRMELSAARLSEKSRAEWHPFEPGYIRNLVRLLNEPVAVFSYGDKEKAKNVIVEVQKDGKNFLAGIHFDQEHRGAKIADIRTIFNKDNDDWLNWINQGKLLYAATEKLRVVVDQRRAACAGQKKAQGETTQQRINSAEVSRPHLEHIESLLRKNASVKHFFPKPGYHIERGHEKPGPGRGLRR